MTNSKEYERDSFYSRRIQEGGYLASAVNHSIVTQGDTIPELKTMISDAVRCHFVETDMPNLIHLYITHEETFAL